jgi:uncharacterized membrane protein
MSRPSSRPGETPSSGAAPELPPSTYAQMALVLRLGLTVAIVLLAAAIAATVAQSPGSTSGYWIATNPLVRRLNPEQLASGLLSGEPTAYLTLGVYALIATPVVRVLAGLGAFAHHGDRRMTALTAGVLALLLLGLFVVGPLVR